MKANLLKPLRFSWALAAVVSVGGVRAQAQVQAAGAVDATVQMPTYEVTAPRFSSVLKEFYEKFDNLTDTTWIDAQGGALIQAIVWRHGFLRSHPSDEAIIYVDRRGDGRVDGATTIYTESGKLYANSYALGEHVQLKNLTAADIHDSAKIEQWLGGINGQYDLNPGVVYVYGREGGRRFRNGRGGFGFSGDIGGPSTGAFTEWGPGGPLQLAPELGNSAELAAANQSGYPNTGQLVPSSVNIFYGGGGFRSALWRAELDDRFHEPESIMLDSVYRALHNPNQAGLVPVALGPKDAHPAIVFDWDGVHYVYRPYVGTVGQRIPSNPVTGLPYLCVKDNGLIESIYFSATYLKNHPMEKAVLVPSDDPSAAYTANGKVCLFSPSLNHFALLPKEPSSAISDQAILRSSVARERATLASLPVPATPGHPHAQHLLEALPGDTADSQMRRIYLAFHEAGIPVHLKSGEAPSLTFTWQGVNYFYGSDQQLRTSSNG